MDRETVRPYTLRLATLTVLGVLTCLGGCRRREFARTNLRDVYAAQKTRPIELRLFGLPYLPAPSASRGLSSNPDSHLAAAAYAALDAPDSNASTRALAFLLLNRSGPAVAALRARAEAESSAAAWNDLAAALDREGRAQSNTRTIAEALAAVDRSLRIDPQMPEALFNRASILQQLGWKQAARQAWKRSLAVDATSPWAAESRASLAAAETPTDFEQWPQAREELDAAVAAGNEPAVRRIVRSFPQQTRTAAEVEDLANWAAARAAGDAARANAVLDKVRAVANALLEANGESLLGDAVAAVAAKPEVLARAHVRYRDARLLIRDRKISEALPAIAEAERLFRLGASPMEVVARYYRAGVLFDLDRPAEAQALLDSLAESVSRFQALRAQVLWEESYRSSRRDEGYASLTPNAASLAIFERLGEGDNAIRIMANRAATLTLLGRDEEAWQLRTRLFALAGRSGRADSVESVLHGSGFAAMQEEQFDVAYSLFSLLFENAGQSPVRRFDAALLRTLAAARIGIGSPADLRDLESAVEALPDEVLKEDGRDELRYATALFRRQSDPDQAIALLSRCIEHRQRRRLWTLAETYAARGEAHRLKGNIDPAMADLERALSLLEEQRSRIDEDPVRDSFFAAANTICLPLVSLQLAAGSTEQSFITMERCRVRVLGDAIAGTHAVAGLTRVRAALDPSTAILYYTVLEERSVAMVIRRDGFTVHPLTVTRKTLESAVAQITATARQRDGASFDAASRRMYSLIVQPVEQALHPSDVLVIVPDDILAPTPFAALRSPAGRYLLEEHELLTAPSATSYAEGVRRSPPPSAPRVTVVADPAFDREVAGELERLPAARDEARDLNALYPQATVLADRDATPSRFLQALADSDLVHIGSHAVVSSRDASQSALVLAADGNGGLLRLSAIRAQRLRRGPLVVLAGCQSAIDGAGKGSVRSLAYAFLEAGARGVVGSVWDVDDTSTHLLSASFHRHLHDGMSASKALRAAQLEMLRSSDPARRTVQSWGAFQYYGFHAVD